MKRKKKLTIKKSDFIISLVKVTQGGKCNRDSWR